MNKLFGVTHDIAKPEEFKEILKEKIEQHEKENTRLRKQIERNKYTMMQVDDVLVEFLGVTHEIMDKPSDFEKVLQEVIDKSKTMADFLPKEPIEVASMLISTTGERREISKELVFIKKLFNISQLRQIAEHLLIYCNANGEREE